MSLYSRVASVFSPSHILELSKVLYSVPDPLSQKSTPDMIRITPDNLEKTYFESPIVYNVINKTTQIIMSANYEIKGDEKSVAFFSNFFNQIGYRGGENDWSVLLTKIFRYQTIYGCAPIELIYGEHSDEIVDLDIIDPKTFDYAKSGNMRIALDKFGNPKGYIQRLPYITSIESKIKPPLGVSLFNNEIYFPPDRIAHFKLYEVGDGFYGIGLIEPIYYMFIKQKTCEEGFANASHRVGYPLITAAAGDERHEATEDQLIKMSQELQVINSKNAFAHPSWIKLGTIETKHPERLRAYLDYWNEMIIAGMGMTKAFALGSGEATNRATLARQEYIMKLTLKDIINRTTSIINSKIIQRVAKLHNEAHPDDIIHPVKIEWGEVALEELDSKAKRITDYAGAKLLNWSPELEKWIRDTENLPGDVQELKVNDNGTG